jgi:hypothetical protein
LSPIPGRGSGKIDAAPGVYFVRASLIYLAVGFTFGGLLLANKGVLISPLIWMLLPIHIEFLFMGWLVQLALDLALWILPRFSKGPPRGNETLTWLALIFINVGILSITLNTVFNIAWFVLIGRMFETVSILAFLLATWRRVRPSG